MKKELANFQTLRSTAHKDLETDGSSISGNFCVHFSDANQWWRPKIPAIFSGYNLPFSKTLHVYRRIFADVTVYIFPH